MGVGSPGSGQAINDTRQGTDKTNIRANANPGTVSSVKFSLDGVAKVENAAPSARDAPKRGAAPITTALRRAPVCTN